MVKKRTRSWLSTLVCLGALFPLWLHAQSLTDSFDATGVPGAANGYNLNEELDVRQSGDAAPALYTVISGNPEDAQVNSDLVDQYGDESGLGKLTLASAALLFSAVQLDFVPPGSDVSLSVEVAPVANNVSLGSNNWACVNLGATGGNGFVNNGAGGMGMLVRDNGEFQVFNNGPLVAQGAVAAAQTYLVEASLNAAGDRYSLSINGELVVDDLAVATTGTLIQLGGQNGNSSPDTPYNLHTFDNLQIDVVAQPVIPCLTANPTAGEAPLQVNFSAACSSATDGIAEYAWNFGDGTQDTGVDVTHTYMFGGNYTVTLTVTDTIGNFDVATTVIAVSDLVESFADDFERADGPVDGWTPLVGGWNISGGEMTTTNGAQTHWVLAGDPPVILPDFVDIQYDYEFLSARPADPAAVGRHGGIILCAGLPASRDPASQSGYTIDWIDRQSDHGVRVIKLVPDAADALLFNGASELDDPPITWRIVVGAETIDIYGDGALITQIDDADYRGGYFGYWLYNNNSLAVDNVAIEQLEQFCSPCFTSGRNDLIAVGEERTFDASCSETSSPVASYSWDFGDGEVGSAETLAHAFAAPGDYDVTLTLETDDGQVCDVTRTVRVAEISPGYFDDFARPDGDVSAWTVISGEWSISDERLLVNSPAPPEAWIYAGSPPRPFGNVDSVSFDVEFLARPAGDVGRHGGVFFFAQDPLDRYQTSGYSIDWIDRCIEGGICDQGYRMGVFHDGVETPLYRSSGAVTEPGSEWLIEFEGDIIRLIVDGELITEVIEGSYRSGYSGMWAYTNGQQIAFDNITAGEPPAVDACFTVEPGLAAAVTTEFAFDASCSSTDGEEIASYAWDFGDGNVAAGASTSHTYASPGVYQVSLTVETTGGFTSTNRATLEAYEVLDRFEDSFAEPDGPPSSWTVVSQDWTVAGEMLTTQAAAAPEAWIWAGAPAARLGGMERLAFDYRFAATPGDGIGRHGGVFFFASEPTDRYAASGYDFDWIDRDDAYRFIVYTDGAPGTPQVFPDPSGEPGERWVVEVDGDTLRLVVDGEVKAEVVDSTYREGYFGFWCYTNGQSLEIDDVSIGVPTVEACFAVAPDVAVPVGDPFTFDASCSLAADTEIAGYSWDFGDGESTGGAVVEHTYTAAGTYDVVLTVTPADGDGDSTATVTVEAVPAAPAFRRGDVDGNTELDVTDAINNLSYQFLGTYDPPCLDACDWDDSGVIDVSDPLGNLTYQFLGGPPSPPPGPLDCGPDGTDDDELGCENPPVDC